MSSTILIDPHNLTAPLPPRPDNLTIDPSDKGSIGIEEIRELIKWAHRKPFQKRAKRVLIRQAQHLTEEAQNALLKILEEPPERTEIVLAVSHPDYLLPTVRSRCQVDKAVDKVDTNIGHPMSDKTTTMPKTIADAFKAAAKLAKLDRHKIIEELDQLILSLREGNLTKHWKSIKTIAIAQRQIRENVNKKLALENLFLKIAQNKSEARNLKARNKLQ